MTTVVDATTVIDAYVKIREQREQLSEQYKQADKELVVKQDRLKAYLIGLMHEQNTTQLKSQNGPIAFQQNKVKYSCVDWTSYWQFIKENNRFDMLHKRIGDSAVTEYFNETHQYPAGINTFTETDVIIRRN